MIAQLIEANKIYPSGSGVITALDKTSLTLYEGEFLLIIGPSGSGKTTLLSMLGCLINPTEGSLIIDGRSIGEMNARQMAAVRLEVVGFVFQQFNLLAPLSAAANVAFPLKMQGLSSSIIKERTEQALRKVNMLQRQNSLPKQLSGGEQQRIAIARALVTNPKIILCDEPTASLDKQSVEVVMNELKQLAQQGKAVAVVTHDPRLNIYADRTVEVTNGVVTPYIQSSQK